MAVSLVDGMGEVMVSVSKDGMVKDELGTKVVWKGVLRGEGMVNIVVSSGPVDMDGVKDELGAKVVWKGVLIGMVNIVVSSGPVV